MNFMGKRLLLSLCYELNQSVMSWTQLCVMNWTQHWIRAKLVFWSNYFLCLRLLRVNRQRRVTYQGQPTKSVSTEVYACRRSCKFCWFYNFLGDFAWFAHFSQMIRTQMLGKLNISDLFPKSKNLLWRFYWYRCY